MGETIGLIGACGTFCLVIFGVITLLLLIADCIALPLTLMPSSCVSYRKFTGGAGEMNYCILYEDDDDMEFAFDEKKDNYPRYDSAAYLLAPPITLVRERRDISGRFDDEDFKRWHYMFPGDYISGTVKCSTDCTVRVVSYLNTCRSTWDYSLGNLSNGGGNRNFRKGPDFNGILGRSSSNKCNYYKYEKEEKEIIGSGTIAFRGDITSEGPAYVEVDDGLFNSPTGSISYSVFQTQIKIARVVKEAHDYPTMFGNLTTQKRFEPYVAVNRFSENMTGEYEIEADYRPSKETLTWVGYGFAIATGAAAAVALLGLIGAILGACLDKSDDSATVPENTSQPSGEEKIPQDSTTPAGETQTPGGDADDHKNDPVDPAPDYNSLGDVPMEAV